MQPPYNGPPTGPPPTGGPPKAGTLTSPAQAPPPTKKQRGGATPESQLSQNANDAIARRRAELDKMKSNFQKRPNYERGALSATKPSGGPPPTTFNSAGGPPVGLGTNYNASAAAASSSMGPPQQRSMEPRRSDIFPSAPKSVMSTDLSTLSAMAHVATTAVPTPKRLDENFMASHLTTSAAAKTTAGPSTTGQRPPPPPPRSGGAVVAPPASAPPVARAATMASQPASKDSKPGTSSAGTGGPPLVPLNKVSFSQPHAGETLKTTTTTREPDKKTTFAPQISQAIPSPAGKFSFGETSKDEPLATNTDPPTNAFAGRTPFPGQKTAGGSITPYLSKTTANTSMAGSTPFPGAGSRPSTELSTETAPPSTARRDMLRDMRAVADSPAPEKKPPTSPHVSFTPSTAPPAESPYPQENTPELRIQRELAQATKEKANALRECAKLEQELEAMKRQVAGQQALRNSNVGFLSPLAPASLPLSPGIASPMAGLQSPGPRLRVPTPHPKRNMGGSQEDVVNVDDEAFLPFLCEAATVVPHEYGSGPVSFVVRRPYGMESNQELWFDSGDAISKVYSKQASVYEETSLEVVALIAADDSKLLVYDGTSVRHGNADGSWQDLSLDEDKGLGNVTYIDSEANEQSYCLDTLYQSALSVRDLYASSLLSTALGLQKKDDEEPALKDEHAPRAINQPPPGTMSQAALKPPTADASVDTQGLPQPKGAPEGSPEQRSRGAPGQPSKPQPVEEENIMGTFLGLVVSMLWTLLVAWPWRIVTTFLTMVVAVLLVSLVWLYLAQQHGPMSLGGPSPPGSLFNPVGVL